MIAIKLGGWHRLWIVLSFLYLILVVFITIDKLPKSTYGISGPYKVLKYMDQQYVGYVRTIRYPWEASIDDNKCNDDICIIKTNSGYSLNVQMPSVKEIDGSTIDKKIFLNSISSEFDQKINKVLARERFSVVVKGFLSWITPVVLLYFLGWCIGWVYRGFKN